MKDNQRKFPNGTLLSLSIVAIALFLVQIASPAPIVFATSSTTSGCVSAGHTGLTAKLVVGSYSDVRGKSINATGCDIGIYVAPWSTDVEITGTVVWGANQHGILVQDSSGVVIAHDLVKANGVSSSVCPPSGAPPPGCIPEDKPIELVGTSYSVVANNLVIYNTADGGIGIADDGPQNPGAPLGVSGANLTAHNILILGNRIVNNTRGCGIVIAAYNFGVRDVWAIGNTIIGQSPSTPIVAPTGPYIGQIVVATDAPNTFMSGIHVLGNTLRGSYLPGIVVHANVFGDKIVNTEIKFNNLINNGYYPGPPNATSNTPNVVQGTTGISIVAENPQPFAPAVISNTLVAFNRVVGNTNGVWLCYTSHTTIVDLDTSASNPVATCAGGGS